MRRALVLMIVPLGFLVGGAGEARAGFETIVGSSDANLTAPTTAGSFTTSGTFPAFNYGLVIDQFAGLNASTVETRSVIEFNLSSLGQGATIQSVTFNFQESSLTSTPGQTVGIYGYTGTGTIGLADATASATLLGTYDPISVGLNTDSVTLTGSALQSLVGNGGYLALRLQATSGYANTTINSLEQASAFPSFDVAPSISVSFTPSAAVPEPSSIVLLCGAGSIAWVGFSRRRLAS